MVMVVSWRQVSIVVFRGSQHCISVCADKTVLVLIDVLRRRRGIIKGDWHGESLKPLSPALFFLYIGVCDVIASNEITEEEEEVVG